MMGWLGFMRHRGEGRFTAAERRRLAPLVRQAQSLLTVAGRLDEDDTPAEPGDLVARPDGTIEHASAQGRHWLRVPRFRLALTDHVRRLDRSRSAASVSALPPSADARAVRVDGRGGVRYVINVQRCEPLRMPPIARLTAAEREVAQLASAGATAREIGRMLGKSHETVRRQLRAIYAKLEVTSRAELVSVISEG